MSEAEDLAAPVEEFGTITFTHKDNSVADVKFDRIAHDGRTLELVSLVAEPMRVKAIRAILHTKSGSPAIKAFGVRSRYPSGGELARESYPGDLCPDQEGYETYLYRLEYGMVHVMFATRNENFLRHLTPHSLWLRLAGDKFSTPITRDWMPYITGELITKRLLRECRCYRANSGVLALQSDDQLDEIVSAGLKSGAIQIP